MSQHFNSSRPRGNELFLRAKTNGSEVFTWIPESQGKHSELERE